MTELVTMADRKQVPTERAERRAAETPKPSDTTLAAFIWKNAEDLWGDFRHTDFGKIILPFTLLRRLEMATSKGRSRLPSFGQCFRTKPRPSIC